MTGWTGGGAVSGNGTNRQDRSEVEWEAQKEGKESSELSEGGRPKRRNDRLGRGLAALLGEAHAARERKGFLAEFSGDENLAQVRQVRVEDIRPNPQNPRRYFDSGQLSELVASIQRNGVIQPVIVRRAKEKDLFEIIAGERRWQAAKQAELKEIPALIMDGVDDARALEMAIVENVQRTDLNPIEEALGYQRLVGEFGYRQEDVGDMIGKSRSHVANTMRLLKLPDSVQEYLRTEQLTAGHGRTLINSRDPEAAAKRMIEEKMNVREAERISRTGMSGKKGTLANSKDANMAALEQMLSAGLGLSVSIEHSGNAGGSLRIAYKSLEELDFLCHRLHPVPRYGEGH